MKILLTGGSGFIGSYVLRFLIERKQHVNVLVRDPSKLIKMNKDFINVYKGSINNYESITRAIEGCEIVIHLAALVSSSAKNAADFYKSNVQGTSNLLSAAAQHKVKRFIFTSSLSAHAFLNHLIINENSLINPDKYFSKYAESKAISEKLVTEYSRRGISYIIIYPARVFGIGSLKDANGAAKAVSLYLKNRLPFLVDHGDQFANWAFVEDIANGIISAALSRISNEKFILGGENRTLADVYRIADNISGKKHLKINLRNKTALFLGSLFEIHAKIFNRRPLITREWLAFILESRKISSEKAISQLNYNITPFNLALERTICWLRTLQ